jgi:hypothetical protein
MHLQTWTFRALAALSIALVMAAVENKVLWGFYLVRPTLITELDGSTGITGAVAFETASRTRAFRIVDRAAAVDRARRACEPRTDDCLEGQLLLRAIKVPPSPPPISDAVALALWRQMEAAGWHPPAASSQFVDSSKIVGGVIITFLRDKDSFALTAARTSEVSNDCYGYIESLFLVGPNGPSLIRQAYYYYEVAGLEGLEWRLLWPINAVVLCVCWMTLGIIARRLRSRRIQQSGPDYA